MPHTYPRSIHARPIIQALSGSLIREVANQGMGRQDVLPFWFGESDRTTADFIRMAAIQSLSGGETFYSQNLGRPYLREALTTYLSALHGRPFQQQNVAALGSGVSALLVASEMLLSAGDKTVAVTPLWPNVTEIPKLLGASVQRVALHIQDNQWTLDLNRLIDALTPDTRALYLNSPNNPTGWTIDAKSIQAILRHCRRHGIWIICDDVYERLIYDLKQKSAPSFLQYSEPEDRIISTNSFSKAWSMTGWRVGWMVVPPELTEDLAKVIEYNFSCIFEPVQRAAEKALLQGEQEIQQMRQLLAQTRSILTTELSKIPGIEIPKAGGGMYAFFRISGCEDSLALAKKLVSQVGLGLAPGLAFGSESKPWLRWCHAVSDARKLIEGINRLKDFLNHSGV